jgi:hypothetical protein
MRAIPHRSEGPARRKFTAATPLQIFRPRRPSSATRKDAAWQSLSCSRRARHTRGHARSTPGPRRPRGARRRQAERRQTYSYAGRGTHSSTGGREGLGAHLAGASCGPTTPETKKRTRATVLQRVPAAELDDATTVRPPCDPLHGEKGELRDLRYSPRGHDQEGGGSWPELLTGARSGGGTGAAPGDATRRGEIWEGGERS